MSYVMYCEMCGRLEAVTYEQANAVPARHYCHACLHPADPCKEEDAYDYSLDDRDEPYEPPDLDDERNDPRYYM